MGFLEVINQNRPVSGGGVKVRSDLTTLVRVLPSFNMRAV